MSKTAKKALVLVGVAALTIVSLGTFTPIAAGIVATLGATTVAGVSALALVTAGAFGAIALGTAPSLTLEETGANARGTAYVDPNALGAYVFGTTTVPLALVFEQVHGINEDRVSNIMAHAWHRINSYVSLIVEGETVNFSGVSATGSWAGIVEWRKNLGNTGQTAISISELPGGEFNWPSTAVFTGVAHSSLTWNFFADPNGNKIKGAVPTHVDIIVEGALLYDPRLDNVYGSGSQDFSSPSTWTFNNGNAALVLLRVLIGERTDSGELIWGRGAAEPDIDMATFVAMADVADETLDGKPRYRLGGMHLHDGDWQGFVRRWEDETGGKLSKSDGVYRVWLPHDDLTPLTAITDADLLAGQSISHSTGGVENLYNTARGRYIEPTQGYKGFPYPEVNEATAIADDEGKRVLPQEFSWVQDRSIAERIARYKIRRSRFGRLWVVPGGWKFQGPNYRPFTVHTLTSPETGDDEQLVRVVDRRRAYSGVTILVLQQEDPSIYDDTLPLLDPHANNEIVGRRLPNLGTYRPRYIDRTPIDDIHGGSYMNADPFFTRSSSLWDGAAATRHLYSWGGDVTAGNSISISPLGGVFGGKCSISVLAGAGSAAGLQAIPRQPSLFVTGETVRGNLRLRKINNPTLTGGKIWLILGAVFDDGNVFTFNTPFNALEIDHTAINGWTSNQWQEYEHQLTLSNVAKNLPQIPYAALQVFVGPLGGDGIFSHDIQLEIDAAILVRIST